MKLKYVEEKLWKDGSIQIDVLENQEKKNQIKRQNRKKMINQTKKVYILAPKETVIGQEFWKIYHNYLVHNFGVIPTPKVF